MIKEQGARYKNSGSESSCAEKRKMSDHRSGGVPGPASGFAGSTGPGYFIPGAERSLIETMNTVPRPQSTNMKLNNLNF